MPHRRDRTWRLPQLLKKQRARIAIGNTHGDGRPVIADAEGAHRTCLTKIKRSAERWRLRHVREREDALLRFAEQSGCRARGTQGDPVDCGASEYSRYRVLR